MRQKTPVTKQPRLIAAVLVLLLAAALIVSGILLGQPADVRAKGATICLECVGIG